MLHAKTTTIRFVERSIIDFHSKNVQKPQIPKFSPESREISELSHNRCPCHTKLYEYELIDEPCQKLPDPLHRTQSIRKNPSKNAIKKT